MPIKPELNVSGYRGIWGQTLTKEIVKKYARAFALFTKEDTGKKNPTILIGRDGRESGPEIKQATKEELLSNGVSVVDGGIMPTPTVLFSVRKHKYDGAIIITASHNPIEYNGLKLVNQKALFTIKEEIEKINKYFNEPQTTETEVGQEIKDIPNFSKEHADQILSQINANTIRERKFKVAIDMINASACVMDPYLLDQLGVEYISLNSIPNGQFGHKPEPLKENLFDLEKMVKENKCDLGFAHDPDADRLVVVNENGEVISEEYSLALGIENVLSKNRGKSVVINLSTSEMSAAIARKYDSDCFRTKIGEGNVVEGILSHGAIIGGEGNGGVIYPVINTVRDSFTSLSLILELLAERRQTVTECIKTLPKFYIKKDKWPATGKNLDDIYTKLKNHFNDAKIDTEDGLRLDFPDNSWIHIRPSNTEPIIRLFGEAKEEKDIEALFEEAKNVFIS